MESTRNRRYSRFDFVKKEHLKLNDLRKKKRSGNENLFKKGIPEYPRPEIHVSHLKHDTDRQGLIGIKKSGGFKYPFGKGLVSGGFKDSFGKGLVWWGLVVGAVEVRSAEQRLLKEKYPDRTEQQVRAQKKFLGKFATSLAFKKSSLFGSYRFTFLLKDLLKAYTLQFCGGEQPVMRVYQTHLYRQEVMYAVLVHSPANQEDFSEYPLLADVPNAVCCYRDGRFIWRPEAMCATHRYELVQNDETQQMEAVKMKDRGYRPFENYVWDNVGVVLHVEDKLLKFDPALLRKKLKFCKGEKLPKAPDNFDDFEKAGKTVGRLWPDGPPLKKV